MLVGREVREAEWYSKMKRKILAQIFMRQLANDESLDQSANVICYRHILEISAALARANTAEAAERKLAIKLLWREAGRGSEPGALSYGGLRWDYTFETPTIESPQSKPSKLKVVPPSLIVVCPFPFSVVPPLQAVFWFCVEESLFPFLSPIISQWCDPSPDDSGSHKVYPFE